MNAPDRSTREVREWLRRSTPTPPDAERSVDDVMSTLFRQSQLQPRSSFRFLGGRGGNQGGSSMFSALKFGVAAALVALFGGLLAIAVVEPQQSYAPAAVASESPSAEATAGPATAVSGRIYPGVVTRSADIETQPDVPQEIWSDYVWEFRAATTDPRLNGTFEFHQNIYEFLADDMFSGTVHSGTGRITNDGGSWVSEFQGFAQPGKNAYHNASFALSFTGEGGYEGLSAMLLMTPIPGSHWEVEGILFPGSFPEPPAAVDPPEID
jgi:hypothetical protein